MKRVFTGVALAGLAASLAACVYYPHGPYGPGYGPPPPAGYNEAPSDGDYGPPPQGGSGPPPQGQYEGPPPQGQYEGPPPQGGGYGGEQGTYGPRPLTPNQIRKLNDPNWCAQHPHYCQKLRNEYAAQQGGPPQQGNYGPPPPDGQYGPPPNANQGPPPEE